MMHEYSAYEFTVSVDKDGHLVVDRCPVCGEGGATIFAESTQLTEFGEPEPAYLFSWLEAQCWRCQFTQRIPSIPELKVSDD